MYNNSYSLHLGDVRFVYFHFKDGGFVSIFLDFTVITLWPIFMIFFFFFFFFGQNKKKQISKYKFALFYTSHALWQI